MILGTLFYIDYQECLRKKQRELEQYKGFALRLGERIQSEGRKLAKSNRLDDAAFYRGDVAFVSLNYDPIGLWIQFIANRELNKSAAVPHVGAPAIPLHLFHDFGHMIPARRIGNMEKTPLWYPLNEAVAQRLNEATYSDCRIRLTKFLFPHGCLCWRECPQCGKLSAYHGEEWSLESAGLIPPPPLRVFDDRPCSQEVGRKEREEREWGHVDARACLHCDELTYAHHTQAIMQSQLKPEHPSFIEEIQRDLRATLLGAHHFILMGYSMPEDDFIYRAIFSALRQRENKGKKEVPVRCTIVGRPQKIGWLGPAELKKRRDEKGMETAKAASSIFGEENIRYYGDGCPNVFLENGKATSAALERLLDWSATA